MKKGYFIIDLETMGTDPDCVVIALSMCCGTFKGQGLRDTFNEVLSNAASYRVCKHAQIEAGRTVDAGTVQFWSKHPEAMSQVKAIPDLITMDQMKQTIFEYLAANNYSGSTHVTWIRAPHFEQPILESIMGETPWSHWTVRDVRTAIDIAVDSNSGYPPNKAALEADLGVIKHHPLHDIAFDIAMIDEFLFS